MRLFNGTANVDYAAAVEEFMKQHYFNILQNEKVNHSRYFLFYNFQTIVSS